MYWFIVIALFAFLAWYVWRKRQAVYRAIPGETPALQSLRQKRYDLLEEISYVDGYVDLLPEGGEAEEVKERRQAAYNRYEEAAQRLENARSEQDFERVQMLFDEAAYDLRRARELIEQLTGGTGVLVSPQTTIEAESPPADTKCYFCQGTPVAQVAATGDGKRQHVWVCGNCLQSIRDGRIPT